MGKKYYEKIARLVKSAEYLTERQKLSLAADFARLFKDDNDVFNRKKWMKACGFPIP